jgi:hypothetical protein
MNTRTYPKIFPLKWQVPDPRSWPDRATSQQDKVTLMELHQDAWNRIYAEHILCPTEPWHEILSHSLCDRLYKSPPDEEAVRQAANEIATAIKAGLERPMAIVFHGSHQTGWIIILPAGALACAKAPSEQTLPARLITCYFPPLMVVNPNSGGSSRWTKLAKRLVWCYGRLSKDRTQLLPPPAPSKVRFVTLETWGFAVDTPNTPWRGRLGSWDNPRAWADPAPRLALRKRCPKESYEL